MTTAARAQLPDLSTEAQIYRYNQVSLGTSTALASKSSDLGTAWSPNLQIWERRCPNLKIWTPADTFIIPENLCFSTYYPKGAEYDGWEGEIWTRLSCWRSPQTTRWGSRRSRHH